MSNINDRDKDKIIDIQQHKDILERDPEITNLLLRMRKVRERVPINYELKEELRQKFFIQKKSEKPNDTTNFISPIKSKLQVEAAKKEKQVRRFQWILFLVPFFIICAAILYSFAGDKTPPLDQPFQREEREIFYDSLGHKNFSVSVSSTGECFFIYRGSLWEINSNGKDSKQLLAPEPGIVFREVALSPDEKQLLLVTESAGSSNLILVDMADFNKKVVLQAQAGEGFAQPAWSPDGGQIAFTKFKIEEEDILNEIYMLNISEAESKPEIVSQGSHATWSPDGKQIAFQRVNDNNEQEIWIVGVDGENAAFWGLGGQPMWSINNLLAFVNDRRWEKTLSYDSEGNPMLISDQRVQEIWVADLEGKVKINLTQLPGPSPEDESNQLREWESMGLKDSTKWELRSSTADNNPQWSPDGTFLIVERNHRNQSTLVWVRAGGME